MGLGDLLASVQGDLAQVAANVQRSMVQVQCGRRGAGTGTVIGADGWIVTSAHVARDGPVEVVLPDGRRARADLEAVDLLLDLAVLRAGAMGTQPIELGSSARLRPGEIVLSMGHAWGVSGGATLGVVIGLGADLPENPQPWRELVAVSLHLRPGHSGGPLVDVEGRLVGINTLMAGPEVGLAVPVDVVGRFLRSVPGRSAAWAA